MVGKTAPRTAADERRFEIIVDIGCLPCLLQRIDGTPAEVHHATECGHRLRDRSEHQNTYGNCLWHQRGELIPIRNGSIKEVEERYGPSLRRASRAYHERYGSEEELVLLQDALNQAYERAIREGRYIPPRQFVRLTRLLHDRIRFGAEAVFP